MPSFRWHVFVTRCIGEKTNPPRFKLTLKLAYWRTGSLEDWEGQTIFRWTLVDWCLIRDTVYSFHKSVRLLSDLPNANVIIIGRRWHNLNRRSSSSWWLLVRQLGYWGSSNFHAIRNILLLRFSLLCYICLTLLAATFIQASWIEVRTSSAF